MSPWYVIILVVGLIGWLAWLRHREVLKAIETKQTDTVRAVTGNEKPVVPGKSVAWVALNRGTRN